jgi:hypothetical protein
VLTAREVGRLSRRDLAGLLRAGHPVRAADLAGYAFRGVSLGLPAAIERLSWKTFQKAFARDGDRVRGWNVRVEQRGLGAPSVPLKRRGAPWSFGPFLVRDRAVGVLLDYGACAGLFDPLRGLRDPLVAVNAGDRDLLLGRSLLQLGPLLVPTPSFFTLEREGPLPA